MGGFLPPAERRSTALLGFYAALSLILLVLGDRLPTATLRGIGSSLFAPFDRVVLSVDRIAASWRENQRLHERIAHLEIENVRLRTDGVENRLLREQLGLLERRDPPLKPVEILALSGEPVPVAAILSAGRDQGVEVGDAVVTADGLLGRVAEVYRAQSRAALLTDLSSAVACEVESTGVLGVLHSVTSPHPRLMLTGVPLADTVRVGEHVVTSGLSRRYPRGLRVGMIAKIGADPSGLVQELEVSPAARFSRLRHGFIVPRPSTVGEMP